MVEPALPPLRVTWPRLATCPMTTCGVPEEAPPDEPGEEEVRGTTPRREEGLGVGGCEESEEMYR